VPPRVGACRSPLRAGARAAAAAAKLRWRW